MRKNLKGVTYTSNSPEVIVILWVMCHMIVITFILEWPPYGLGQWLTFILPILYAAFVDGALLYTYLHDKIKRKYPSLDGEER